MTAAESQSAEPDVPESPRRASVNPDLALPDSELSESAGPESVSPASSPPLRAIALAQGDLAAALRALPAQAFARHQPEALRLRARLVALRERLLAPPVFDRH